MGGPKRSEQQLREELATMSRRVSALEALLVKQRQAEEERRQTEQLLMLTVDHAPLGIATIHLDGSFRSANRALCDMLGRSAEELGRLTLVDVTHPDDVEKCSDLFKGLVTGETSACNFEKRYVRKDGSPVPSVTRAGVVRASDGTPLFVMGIAEDVTERRRTEAALQQSEERYRSLVETTSDLIWELDEKGAFTYVSPQATKMLGYAPEELIGKTPFDLMPSDEAARVSGRYHEAVGTGEVVTDFEAVRLRKDGQRVVHEVSAVPVYDVDGKCRGYRGISRNITRRKEAKRRLQEQHDELQAIYDGTAEGLLVADVATKRLVRANESMCRMLGYSEQELLSLSVMDVHPQADLKTTLETFETHAACGMTVAEQVPVLRKDETVFFADISTSRIMYHGRPCLLGFFRDITERKETLEALQREHRTLLELLESHDRERQLIAYEIHDGLAQQLTAAIMHCQTLHQIRQPSAASVLEHCEAMRQMLAECLAEARRLIGGVRPPILDDAGVVAAIEDLIQRSRAETRLEIEFHNEIEFTRLEPVLEHVLYRIAQESLANACRHGKSPRVRVELARKDAGVRFTVQDWGVGFDPQTVHQKRFGLAGMRERARLLGGQVTIDSTLGKGTRVVVELPLKLDRA
ncbi:MAG: sensor histidine kinase [Planctomycetota bacterium]|jgi:PAS domain S-box-containing protein